MTDFDFGTEIAEKTEETLGAEGYDAVETIEETPEEEKGGGTEQTAQTVKESGEEREPTPTEEAERIAREEEIEREIYELTLRSDVAELSPAGKARYTELRMLGLTEREAFCAASATRTPTDSRAHLGSAVPRAASAPRSGISARELKEAREIFSGASDAEILRLYRRVTEG